MNLRNNVSLFVVIMSEKFWRKVAIFMVNVGKVPFPISDNLITFIQANAIELLRTGPHNVFIPIQKLEV